MTIFRDGDRIRAIHKETGNVHEVTVYASDTRREFIYSKQGDYNYLNGDWDVDLIRRAPNYKVGQFVEVEDLKDLPSKSMVVMNYNSPAIVHRRGLIAGSGALSSFEELEGSSLRRSFKIVWLPE